MIGAEFTQRSTILRRGSGREQPSTISVSSSTSGKGHSVKSFDKMFSCIAHLRHAAFAGKNCSARFSSHALTPLRQVMPLTWLVQVGIAHMEQA